MRAPASAPSRAAAALAALLACSALAHARQAAPAPASTAPAAATAQDAPASTGGLSEDQLKQMLVGKTFYLRGGYLDDSLSFNEHGVLSGRAAQGSYTLSMIQIEKVSLGKRKVTLDGVRYGLHFLGALPYEDPSTAVDRVRITPKKKTVRITIDREQVVKPKKQKPEKPGKGAAATAAPAAPAQAATPAAEQPVDSGSITTTTSPAHAGRVLKDALDRIFAPTLDARMMDAMPGFWKLYYQAAAAKMDYQPAPGVLRQSQVDRKARLLTAVDPQSNQYAQDNGVAGMALYHAVIGPDGKPGEIAVARPIGFGLDENAVDAIRKARFEPAIKDGKPVPVLLDLVVEFRIYSKRTATASATATPQEPSQPPAAPPLAGPYSVQHPQ
jgi:TonB family protein